MKWLVFFIVSVLFVTLTAAEGEIWEEDDHEVLIRNERGAKTTEQCRYSKGDWSECDVKTNMRSRTLTLKKGDQKTCEPSKKMQKKCRRACRYEKGTWSECVNNQMTRVDKLKPNSDPSCEKTRKITKKCRPKPGKGKGSKRPHGNRQ